MRRPLRPRPLCRKTDWRFRPRVFVLEDRLPPGDLLLGRALGAAGPAAAIRAATPTTEAPLAVPGTPLPNVSVTPRPVSAPAAPAAPPTALAPAEAVAVLPGAADPLDTLAAADPLRGANQAPVRHFVSPGAGLSHETAAIFSAAPVAAPGLPGAAPDHAPFVVTPPAGNAPAAEANAVAVTLLAADTGVGSDAGPARPGAGVHALFHLDVQSQAPFPANVFTVPDRSQNTGVRVHLPYPDCQVYVSDCEDIAVLNELDGFNLQPRLSVPFDGAIDPHSVTSRSLFLVSLGDTLDRHDRGGQIVGINQVVWDVATTTLHVESDALLDQHTRYALIVTNGVRDANGRPVEPSAEFRHFRRDVHGEYRRELDEAVHAARRAGVRERDVVAASVFTTQSATAVLEKVRDQIHAATPEPADFNLGPNGERTVFAFDHVNGIHWEQQTGDNPPSFTPSEFNLSLLRDIIPGVVGQIAYGKFLSPDYEVHPDQYIPPVGTRTGIPAVQGMNEIYFNLVLPSGPRPANGWPVAIFGHGGGASKDTLGGMVNVAASMAAHGVATIGINAVGSGFGPLGTLTVNDAGGGAITFPSGGRGFDQNENHVIDDGEGRFASAPRKIVWDRDGFRQTTADLMQLVRVIEVGVDVDGDSTPDLDPNRVYYFGQSFGGNIGPIFLAVEPSVRLGVFNVAGGSTFESFRLSPQGTNRASLGRFLDERTPSLINSPGIVGIEGVSVGAPYFNDNLPLRDGVSFAVDLTDGSHPSIQSPVINTVAGAMEIQEVLDNAQWVTQSGVALAYAPHLRKAPLPGVPAKSVVFQSAKGDYGAINPLSSVLQRAGDLADRVTFYRHDLAYAEIPGLPKNPHGFMVNTTTNPSVTAIALEAQRQIATFFASDGEEVIQPEPARYFEVPIQGPLPEDLNFIP